MTNEIVLRDGRVLTVAKAKAEDIREILELQEIATDRRTFYPITEGELLESIEHDLAVVLRDGNTLAGFMMTVAPRVCERNLAKMAGRSDNRTAYFDGVIVAPDYRGQGIQSALLEIAEDYASSLNATALLATVSQTNVYSRRNFSARGYKELCEIGIYDGSRLLLMKEL